MAEAAVTIAAASIPVLRALIQEAKNSSPRGYDNFGKDFTGLGDPTRKSRMRTLQSAVTVTANRLPSEQSEGFQGDDGASDKSIIGKATSSPATAAGRIVRRDEVTVAYSPREDNSDGYELRNM